MDRHNIGEEKLIAPTDFMPSTGSRQVQEDLVPPSHFASCFPSTGANRGVRIQGAPPTPISWMNPRVPTATLPAADRSAANPWLAITQAQQEILELRKENQKIMMLQGDNIRGRVSVEQSSDLRARSAERSEQWSRWDSEWHLEAQKHKTESERLKGQVEVLKESARRHREEMRDRDSTVSRQSHELEEMREELCKAKSELTQLREELVHSNAQKDKISSRLERVTRESAEEIAMLCRDVERSKEEAQELAIRAEMTRLQAEEEAKQQTYKLSEQLEDMQRKQELELQQLSDSHSAKLDAARQTNTELQDRLQSMTSEMLQLKSTLMAVSTERDGLKDHLSKMGQAFETQSVTLHSLRNYIGQVAPENGEKEQLNDAVKKLNKEKAALQKTTELLTVRLTSLNEILTIQEEKIVKKTSTDPLMKNRSEGLQVLQLWREKVFKLCVQLRTKDIELRGEKDKLLAKVAFMEQQLQQEQHRANVLQHGLDDKVAELDLGKVEMETLKQELAQVQKENFQLKSKSQKVEAELKSLTETAQRCSLAFANKVAEMDAAQSRLNAFTQRLSFANRRVETIQGLLMRRAALQKVQQASKLTEQASHSIANLRTELSLVCEERDKLTQELKRTPELIEKTLVDLREQYEGKLKQQQQDLEQRCMEVRLAVAGREAAEQGLQQVQAQLEESRVNLEKLCTELLIQQEQSERALQERVSEIEDRCGEKLREMEVQVSTARREHTKAVMTLRHFEREAARKQSEMTETHTKREHQSIQPKETCKTLPATSAEGGRTSEDKKIHTTLERLATPREQQQKPSEWGCSVEAQVQLPANERLLSVLEELHTLSAAVVNSSEDSADEEEQNNLLHS